MNGSALASVRSEALRLGYVLRPVPPMSRATAELVRRGITTSRLLADAEHVHIATAHMRMRNAERFGLIVEDHLESHPSGGIETTWRVSVAPLSPREAAEMASKDPRLTNDSESEAAA